MVLFEKFAKVKQTNLIFTVAFDGEREKRIRDIIKKLKVTLLPL